MHSNCESSLLCLKIVVSFYDVYCKAAKIFLKIDIGFNRVSIVKVILTGILLPKIMLTFRRNSYSAVRLEDCGRRSSCCLRIDKPIALTDLDRP